MAAAQGDRRDRGEDERRAQGAREDRGARRPARLEERLDERAARAEREGRREPDEQTGARAVAHHVRHRAVRPHGVGRSPRGSSSGSATPVSATVSATSSASAVRMRSFASSKRLLAAHPGHALDGERRAEADDEPTPQPGEPVDAPPRAARTEHGHGHHVRVAVEREPRGPGARRRRVAAPRAPSGRRRPPRRAGARRARPRAPGVRRCGPRDLPGGTQHPADRPREHLLLDEDVQRARRDTEDERPVDDAGVVRGEHDRAVRRDVLRPDDVGRPTNRARKRPTQRDQAGPAGDGTPSPGPRTRLTSPGADRPPAR